MPVRPKSGARSGKARGRAKRCPICGKPATEASKPFCSERCRDDGLNRLLDGSYAIRGKKDEDEDAE